MAPKNTVDRKPTVPNVACTRMSPIRQSLSPSPFLSTPLLILTPSSCFRPAGDILFPAVYLISSFVLGIMQSCLKGTLAQQAGVFAPCLIHYSTSPVSGS